MQKLKNITLQFTRKLKTSNFRPIVEPFWLKNFKVKFFPKKKYYLNLSFKSLAIVTSCKKNRNNSEH